MSSLSGWMGYNRVHWTAVFNCPLHDIKMIASVNQCILVPGALVLSKPLQNIEFAVRSCALCNDPPDYFLMLIIIDMKIIGQPMMGACYQGFHVRFRSHEQDGLDILHSLPALVVHTRYFIRVEPGQLGEDLRFKDIGQGSHQGAEQIVGERIGCLAALLTLRLFSHVACRVRVKVAAGPIKSHDEAPQEKATTTITNSPTSLPAPPSPERIPVMVEPLDPDAIRITPGFLRTELSQWGPDGQAVTKRNSKPVYYWGVPSRERAPAKRPAFGAPVQPNFTLTVTAQEADDDFKQIQAAIRADADLTKGGKRKRKQGNKASKTPERASPRGDGVGEEGVKRTAVGSLSPAPRDMNGDDRREA